MATNQQANQPMLTVSEPNEIEMEISCGRGEHTECQCLWPSKNLNLISGDWSTSETDEKWPQNVGRIQLTGRFRPNTASVLLSLLPIRIRIPAPFVPMVFAPDDHEFVKLWLTAFCGTHCEPATVGSHAYLMSSQLGVLAAYFVKLLGRFQHSVTSFHLLAAPTHMQLQWSRLGTDRITYTQK